MGLLHPNELERVQLTADKRKAVLLFLRKSIAFNFWLRYYHRLQQRAQREEGDESQELWSIIEKPHIFDSKYIARKAAVLDCGVYQRPLHSDLDPSGYRQSATFIPRWTGVCGIKFKDKTKHIVLTVVETANSTNSIPNQSRTEKIKVNQSNVDHLFIAENTDCIVIEFWMSSIPILHQYRVANQDSKRDSKEYSNHSMNSMDIHSSHCTQICPRLRIFGHCNDPTCRYPNHLKRDQTENGDTTSLSLWKNQNYSNGQITGSLSARQHPLNLDEEFMSFNCSNSEEKQSLYLQDVIHRCFVLRVSILKYSKYGHFHDLNDSIYFKLKLNDIFSPTVIPKRFIINAPTEQLESTLRALPYPLHRLHLNGSIQYDDDRDSFHFLSPLKYRNPEHLQNIDYGATMKQFIDRLNREHGRYHLEAFCLTACLTNYPLIFVPEDFHISDLELLRRHIEDVKVGGNGRVWQTLKRLSEGKGKTMMLWIQYMDRERVYLNMMRPLSTR